MRILLTFAGGSGHLKPLIPIARAAVAAGHVVAFVGRPWMAPKVEAFGFEAFSAGTDDGLAPVRRPLLPLDAEREEHDLREGFARHIARERAAHILPVIGSWRPDLLVCEETDFGPMIVGERLGIPAVTVIVTAAGSFVRANVVAEALDEVRAEHGLSSDPTLEMAGGRLVLSPMPPSLRDPSFPLPPGAVSMRPAVLDDPIPDELPGWWVDLTGGPILYVTLGTVFNMESGDLFGRVLAGVRDLPIEIIVTVGRDLDPAALGPQPAHVHIERFIPQATLLPNCSAVVSHGGSGSVIGALAFGLPMVVIPMGADQPNNAARCASLGVGRVLDPVAARPADVRAAVTAVLDDPSYRVSAERLRDESVALPRAAEVIPRLVEIGSSG